VSFLVGGLILTLGLYFLEAIAICHQNEIHVLKQCLCHLHPHVLPQGLSIGHITELLIVEEAAIRGLNSIRERHSYLAKDDCPCSGLFERVDLEDTGVVAKHRSDIP
jgi:hypothetical protein